MNRKFITWLLLNACIAATAQTSIDLGGQWTLTDTAGVALNIPVSLPGTLDMAGIGQPSSLPLEMGREQLRHLTRRVSFVGQATYTRTITVPKSLAGKPLRLTLERVLWKSRVSIDGQDIGQTQESLVAPHVFRIAKGLKAGNHQLQLTIDNRQQYDISYQGMAHAYTDETQTRWNGVLGAMRIEAEPAIGEVQVMRLIPSRPEEGKPSPDTLVVDVSSFQGKSAKVLVDGQPLKALRTGNRWKVLLSRPLSLWDEFSPSLHELTIQAGRVQKTVRFGCRTLSGKDGELRVNGRKTFLRGTLECCIFPLTGVPPTDDAGWLKVFDTARQWGLNHLRFHSYCPPDAAFRVADSLGFYLQVELPVWSTTLEAADTATCRFMRQEYDRIVSAYGNHPSLCFISCGNELQRDFTFLNELTAYMKSRDPRRLHTTTTFTFEKGHGSHPEPQDEFFVTQWSDNGWVRGQGVFDSEPPAFNRHYDASLPATMNVPFISHEIGQYAVYPNLQEISKYTGTLAPLNLRAVRQDLQQKGLLSLADRWCQASGKLAVLLYKEEIERALKTRRQSGFQLLGLQDFPGQSTALVGLVDAFWDNKGFTTPAAFRQACAPVVPLANFEKAVYTNDETFTAELLVANYGPSSLVGKTLTWSLGHVSGTLPISSDGHGLLTLAPIRVPLGFVSQATCLTLTAAIEGTEWRNSWHIWVYPSQQVLVPGNVVMTQDPAAALTALAQGRDVLLSPRADRMNGLEGKFVPVFWSPVHFPKQAGTMGILCDPRHPALSLFPTDSHSDWQWWQLVKNAKVMVLDSLFEGKAANIPSMGDFISCVDNFANNRRLSLVLEARCGGGRLLLTSMDLLAKADAHPEARQILHSLLRYMNSSNFAPGATLQTDQLFRLLTPQSDVKHSKATDIYDE